MGIGNDAAHEPVILVLNATPNEQNVYNKKLTENYPAEIFKSQIEPDEQLEECRTKDLPQPLQCSADIAR